MFVIGKVLRDCWNIFLSYSNKMKVKFKWFSRHPRMQIRATSGSTGYDLFLAEKVEFKPISVQKILTDIGLKNLKKQYGRICSHSIMS